MLSLFIQLILIHSFIVFSNVLFRKGGENSFFQRGAKKVAKRVTRPTDKEDKLRRQPEQENSAVMNVKRNGNKTEKYDINSKHNKKTSCRNIKAEI